MDGRLISGVLAGVLLLGIYWWEAQDSVNYNLPTEYATGPEARNWLKENRGESVLASNRFGDTANAVKFVGQLYDAGAERVSVPLACIRADEVETYADGLVVTLPADADKRARVWATLRRGTCPRRSQELLRRPATAAGFAVVGLIHKAADVICGTNRPIEFTSLPHSPLPSPHSAHYFIHRSRTYGRRTLVLLHRL